MNPTPGLARRMAVTCERPPSGAIISGRPAPSSASNLSIKARSYSPRWTGMVPYHFTNCAWNGRLKTSTAPMASKVSGQKHRAAGGSMMETWFMAAMYGWPNGTFSRPLTVMRPSNLNTVRTAAISGGRVKRT